MGTVPVKIADSADRRTFTLRGAIFLGIGSMVGAGIFALVQVGDE